MSLAPFDLMLSAATMNNETPQQFYNYGVQQCYPPMLPPSFVLIGDYTATEKRSRGEASNQHQQNEQRPQQDLGYYSTVNGMLKHSTTGTAHEVPLPESSAKRSKPNNYEAPRTIRPSVLTAMGSLAVGGSITQSIGLAGTHGPPSAFVHHRRQLSGGAIEQFIGGHDIMDTDTHDHSRPRSMSF